MAACFAIILTEQKCRFVPGKHFPVIGGWNFDETNPMKAIIQRVTSASVTVCDERVSSIGRGLCVLVGISMDDNANDVDWLARKLLNIRLFEEPATGKRWMQSVSEQQLEILCVSQFTLYHRMKGNRPDFSRAMQGPQAQELYGTLLQKLREQYTPDRIKDGVFGAMMQVHIQNDGPVTLEIESPPQTEQERQKLQRSQGHKAKVKGASEPDMQRAPADGE